MNCIQAVDLPIQSRDTVILLYLIEGLELPQLKLVLERDLPSFIPALTTSQWKSVLSSNGIFKTLNDREVLKIKSQIPGSLETWRWLIFASDVLVENEKIEQHHRRMDKSTATSDRDRRAVNGIPLLFDFTVLKDSDIFKSFQRLLFYTRVYFESCFDFGIWVPDERGLYARNEELRASLSQLSKLHNVIVDALRQFRDGEIERRRALIRSTSLLYISIVKSYHHRQFSDILAVLLLLHRARRLDVMHEMKRDFCTLAKRNLLPNDPRNAMFASLEDEKLPLDSTGHLYLAYDAYCRYLWFSRLGTARAKDHYSYNQASFPRANPGGFYDFFRVKNLVEIKLCLVESDEDLGEESHESFMLWHTAVRSLGHEGRYREMLGLIQSLCCRVNRLFCEYDHHQPQQLNVDSSLSYYLLGDAYEKLGDLQNARVAFYEACRLRDIIIPVEAYDSPRISALIKLQSVTRRLDAASKSSFVCQQLLNGMYSDIV